MANIGKNIRNARLNAKLSQTQLAEKIGVTKATISKYENNQITGIKLEIIEEIAKYTETDISELMGWQEEKRKADAAIEVINNEYLLQIIECCKDMNERQIRELTSYAKYIKKEGF